MENEMCKKPEESANPTKEEECLLTSKRSSNRRIQPKLRDQGTKLPRLKPCIQSSKGLDKLGAANDVIQLLLGAL